MTDDVDIIDKLNGIGWANSIGYPPKDDLLSHAIEVSKEASAEIERLREKCDMQAKILRQLTPDKYPGTIFIHAEIGSRDTNNMPETLLVVPSYGVDFSYVYERTEKTVGPEW